jgi:hypothetical protein
MNSRMSSHYGIQWSARVQSDIWVIETRAVSWVMTVAVARRDYAAGRLLLSLLEGRILSEGDARSMIDLERRVIARKWRAERRARQGG